jgi:cytochrome P450
MEAWPATVYKEPLVVSRIMGRQITYVMSPDLIREVLQNQGEAFEKGEFARRGLKPVLGDAILTAEGSHWRWQRRAAAPAFRPEHLSELLPSMLTAAQRRHFAWRSIPDGTEINVAHEMMRTTFDVILDAMLSGRDSMDAAPIEQAITDYLASMGWVIAFTMLRLPSWVPYPGSRASARARAYLRRVAALAVRRTRQTGSLPTNLLTALASATDPTTGRSMNDQDLADNFLTFMTAGHETTALALTWTFYLLSLHPSIEQRVIQEIDAVTRGESLQVNHLEALTYTRQVLLESIRLYPPAPLLVRTARRDVSLGGEVIPAGTHIFIPIYAVHRHSHLWKDPDRFDPERFRPDLTQSDQGGPGRATLGALAYTCLR